MKKYIRTRLINRSRKKISINRRASYEKKFSAYEFGNKSIEGEKEYIDRWKGILPFNVDPFYYRLYSTISGKKSVDFVPQDIYNLYVLRLLNGDECGRFYSDKNSTDLIFSEGIFPHNFIRNINGSYFTNDYKYIKDVDQYISSLQKLNDKLIIKPSRETSAGKNIFLFHLEDGCYIDKNRNRLTKSFLDTTLGSNFIIQAHICQSQFLSRFNSTSVNTIRIYTYRSVKTNDIHILCYALRVGANKEIVDNFNSGGYSIGLKENGVLFDYAIDKFGHKSDIVNGINLKEPSVIPQFYEYSEVAKSIAEKYIYHRFLGLDMLRDSNGNIRLIEVNSGYIGIEMPQLLGMPVFGKYTDEVIEYCRVNKNKLNKKFKVEL